MQYLHLVYRAEQKPKSMPYIPRPVTDGPFIETKEYLAGGQAARQRQPSR
jgi:hypothetical protein